MILVTVPNDGWVHKTVIQSVMTVANDPRYAKAIDFPSLAPPVDNFFNQACKMIRENGDFEWWLNIDDDNAPTKNPLDLIELGKPIMGCPTPVWRPDKAQQLQWNAYDRVGRHLYPMTGPHTGFKKVGAVGSGCMLIHRSVIEAIPKYTFLSCYNEEGIRTMGPDTSFSYRAHEAGFEMWAHFDYPCFHIKEVNLLDLMNRENQHLRPDEGKAEVVSELPSVGASAIT